MIKKILALVLALLLPVQVWAAITRETPVTGEGADDFTTAVTVTAGSNLALVALCFIQHRTRTLTATYDGSAMTEITNKAHTTASNRIYAFVIVNPTTGGANFVTNISAAANHACILLPYAGVDQTTPTANATSTEGTGATSSALSVTCASGNNSVDLVSSNNLANFTADGENTEITEYDAGTNQTGSFSEDTSPDGTVNMSWSFTAEESVHVAFCLNAASTAIPTASPIWFH